MPVKVRTKGCSKRTATRRLVQVMGISCCLAPGLSQSSTIHVPGNQPTIQAGINAAVNGDTVLVAPGTYTGSSNRNLDFAGKAIVLRSSAGAATTIIDCQNVARGFRFHTNETTSTIVDGLTIKNGNAGGGQGGGISIESASPAIRNCVLTTSQAINGGGVSMAGGSPRFTACQFTGGSAVNWGGGVYGEALSTPTLLNCTIGQNSAAFGAGMFFTLNCTATLIGCALTANTAITYGSGIFCQGSSLELDRCDLSQHSAKRGAAIYFVDGASAAFDSCSFTMNSANEAGGAIFCQNIASLSLKHSEFSGNRTLVLTLPNAGGGLYCVQTSQPSTFLLEDCTFTGNTVVGDGGSGGGFYMRGALAEVTRCTFSGNSAGRGGGAAIVGEGTLTDCQFINNTSVGYAGGVVGGNTLIRCSFSGNHAGSWSGAAFYSSGSFLAEDCSFVGNTATNAGGGVMLLRGSSNFVGSTFHGNSAAVGGAVYFIARGDNVMTDCTLYDNSAAQGAALYVDSAELPLGVTTITRCTIASNVAPTGAGIVFEAPAVISRSIIAFGENGEAVSCFGAGMPALSCTDIFGNDGGDWTACISDQLGINGNFAANPRFCAPLAGDFTLAQDSPCSPAHSPAGCGTIGSQPVGCASPIAIADVGTPTATPQLRIIPNPLRAAGVIEWTMPVEAFSLYNTAGRLVARHELDSGVRAARGHLAWQDFIAGKRLAPGIYFLRTFGPLGVKLADETVVLLR